MKNFVYLLFALVFIGCNKDDEQEPVPSDPAVIIEEIEFCFEQTGQDTISELMFFDAPILGNGYGVELYVFNPATNAFEPLPEFVQDSNSNPCDLFVENREEHFEITLVQYASNPGGPACFQFRRIAIK